MGGGRFAVVVLAACASTPKAPPIVGTATPSATPAKTLGDELARDVGRGRSVAILGDDRGLVAMSSDGTRARVLVPGKPCWVLTDELSNVAWFGTDDCATIKALDLDAPPTSVTPITIATNIPARTYNFSVRYPDDDPMMSSVMTSWDFRRDQVVVALGPKPSLYGVRGVAEYGSDTIEDDVAREAKLVSEFPATLVDRPAHSATAGTAMAVTVPFDPLKCPEDPEHECGKGTTIPNTRLARGTIEYTCHGGRCSATTGIYDLDAKRFLEGEWTGWLEWGAAVAPDGSAFVKDGQLVSFKRGVLPANGGAPGGGWLGGGTKYLSM